MDVKITGHWWATLYGAPNEVKQSVHGKNVITTVGLQALVDHLASAAAAASAWDYKYIAIGSNNAAESASNTALGTETARATATVSTATSIYRLTATFASGIGTGNIYEYAVFSTITTASGSMFSRDTEGLITKGANDTLIVTTEITVS
jgi:hypothetical protein